MHVSISKHLCRIIAVCLATIALSAYGAPPVEHQIAFGGAQLALWEKRPAAPQRAILLIHGRTWSSLPDFDLQVPGRSRSVMDALVARGFAVYALDLPGYGGSPRLASGWLTPLEAVAATAAALQWIATEARGLGKPVLFGWSNGSRVAHLVAQRHADLISDLILYGFPFDPAKTMPAMPEPAEPPREKNTVAKANSDFITPGSIEPEVQAAFVKAALAADPVRADWDKLQEWSETDPAKVTVPVLLLHGVFDPLTPAEAQARSFTKFAHADRQWIILPASDHAALIEKSHDAFIAAIVQFVHRPRATP